jgi:hypothetical protein
MIFAKIKHHHEMIRYTPSDCHHEYDIIKCKSLRMKKKFLWYFYQTIYYNNISYIKIRKYDKNPKIMLFIYFTNTSSVVYHLNILELVTFNHKIIL